MIETTSLYNGEILCEFNEARHTYTIINKGRRFKVPSVTRITSIIDKSGPLMAWAINNTLDVCKGAIYAGTEYSEVYLEAVWDAAKKQSRSIKDEAARKGKERHSEIEVAIRANQVGTILALETNTGETPLRQFNFRETERRIYSRRHRYSGTLDALAKDGEDRLVLLDWKTSKSIYPEFRLQTAAYVHAYEEEHPDIEIAGRYLVRIAEDGSIDPHYYPRSTLRKDFQAFLGAKALFDRVQVIEKEGRKKSKPL